MVLLRALLKVLFVPACATVAVGLPDSFLPNLTLFLLYPISLVVLLIWTVINLARAGMAIRRRVWMAAAIYTAAIGITVISFGPALGSVRWVSRYLHLATFVARDTMSPVHPDKQEGQADVFDWDGQGLAAGASEMRYLVRDPSRKTRAAVGDVPTSDYPGASIETRHLAGNYYLRVLHYP